MQIAVQTADECREVSAAAVLNSGGRRGHSRPNYNQQNFQTDSFSRIFPIFAGVGLPAGPRAAGGGKSVTKSCDRSDCSCSCPCSCKSHKQRGCGLSGDCGSKTGQAFSVPFSVRGLEPTCRLVTSCSRVRDPDGAHPSFHYELL